MERKELAYKTRLEDLSVKEFATQELTSWLQTTDENLIESQAQYIVSGSITGDLPLRYSAVRYDAKSQAEVGVMNDSLFRTLGLRPMPDKEFPSRDVIGDCVHEIALARCGDDALSELTLQFVRENPAIVREVVGNMPQDCDKDFVLKNISILRKIVERAQKSERQKELIAIAGLRLMRSKLARERLKNSGLVGEQVLPIGNAFEGLNAQTNARDIFIAQQVNWHGVRGGGSPAAASQVNTSGGR